MKRRLPSFFACLVAACESPTGIPFPSDAIRFTPPSIYREWWSLTEACSGRQAAFDKIAWYVVPDASTLPGTTNVSGAFYPLGNRIALAGAEDGISEGSFVRHEMLHAIIRAPGHPRDFFVGKCGGVVLCEGECLTDAGPAPPPDPVARPEPASSLDVTVSVEPSAPGSGAWDGYFMMFIHARNPAGYPVLVQLPASGDAGPPGSFGYDIESQQHGGVLYDMRAEVPEVTRFAAGETKQFIFDFHNVPGPYYY